MSPEAINMTWAITCVVATTIAYIVGGRVAKKSSPTIEATGEHEQVFKMIEGKIFVNLDTSKLKVGQCYVVHTESGGFIVAREVIPDDESV